MLLIEIPERELFDESTSEFILLKKESFQIEHSLVSLSKWESKWCKPFLGKDEKTTEETVDYIRCMTITQNVKPEVYNILPNSVFKQVEDYINAPMAATWFNEKQNAKNSRKAVTAEIIYYWMIAQNIPMECQKWHLNRLLTLIRVCNIENTPPGKKKSSRESAASRAALNAARKVQLQTKG